MSPILTINKHFSPKNAYRKEKVWIFVFDAEVLENTDIPTLIANRYYLKKYELSLSDLQQINWKIIF